MKPDQLEDIVAAVALYRPGPLEGGMVDDFIERKHGRKKVEYPHPDLEGVLKDTYGVIVYQEQVMQIAQVLAGYSLGGADLLRRAMGKKIKEVMDLEKVKFMEGALGRGVDKKIADQVFELMAFFAGYGFNRSHSAAYGWITYQTAFLKWHYPHEFMAGLMSCDRDNTDNIVKFIAEARSMGLTVERPDVNESASDFTVVQTAAGKVIRFGLGAVKGVGQGAVHSVTTNRTEEGPFESIYEFCRRVDSQKCNKRVIEALVKSGAYDGLENHKDMPRSRIFAAIEPAVERGAQDQKDRRSGQTNLFGLFEPAAQESGSTLGEVYPEEDEEWTPKQLLAFEKESLGFYISGHPLDRFRDVVALHADARTTDFTEGGKTAGKVYKVGGVVSAYRERPTRKGDGKLAFFQLEDATGQLEVMVFPKTFEKVRGILISDEPLMCIGKVVDEGEGGQHAWKMLLEEVTPLSELGDRFSRLDIWLDESRVDRDNLDALVKILNRYRGGCTTVLRLKLGDRSETSMTLGDDWKVSHGDELQARLDRLFGERVFKFS